uniref:Uncharacterized protein n=1 Tax=Anguilla anguilla TaxID=7936 RepID=A0A0E9VX69_ANGAN
MFNVYAFESSVMLVLIPIREFKTSLPSSVLFRLLLTNSKNHFSFRLSAGPSAW